MAKRRHSKVYLLLTIGCLSAFGPFVTDFYLPALPALGEYFRSTASQIQLSLTFSLIGLAAGQLFIGPLSDKYGRKLPLMVSLAIFCVATLGCLYSPDIYWFLASRLLQGLAASGGVVISKSVVTDLYKGKEYSDFFAMIGCVQGLGPVVAPVLGGVLLAFADWKGIFWILTGIGLALLLALSAFSESLPREQRKRESTIAAFRHYGSLIRNTSYLRYTAAQALSTGVLFTYISASPFIFQNHFNLSATSYSLVFGLNAVGMMIGSVGEIRFRTPLRALRTGTMGTAILCLPLAAVLIFANSIYLAEIVLIPFLLFLGFNLPSSIALALDLARENPGSASAFLGFMTFLSGGVVSPLTGLGNMLVSVSIIIVICCAANLVCVNASGRHGIPVSNIKR